MSNTEQNQAIDVAALLEALRTEVRAHARVAGDADPLDAELQRCLDEIELNRVVSAHWPLTGTTIPQKAIALVNKLVRRGLRWYINPIVEQQNAYNDAVARTLRLLATAYAEVRSQESGDFGELSRAVRSQVPAGGEQQTTDHRPQTTGDEGQDVAADQRVHSPSSVVRRPWSAPANLQSQSQQAYLGDIALRASEPQLRLRQSVSAHWPLPQHSLGEKAAAVVHKAQRRYLRWMINPIVEQQNAANTAITAALVAAIRLDAQRRAESAARRAAELRSEK